jgi:hypothetical protein
MRIHKKVFMITEQVNYNEVLLIQKPRISLDIHKTKQQKTELTCVEISVYNTWKHKARPEALGRA